MNQIIRTAAFTLAKMLGNTIEMKLIDSGSILQGQMTYPYDTQ